MTKTLALPRGSGSGGRMAPRGRAREESRECREESGPRRERMGEDGGGIPPIPVSISWYWARSPRVSSWSPSSWPSPRSRWVSDVIIIIIITVIITLSSQGWTRWLTTAPWRSLGSSCLCTGCTGAWPSWDVTTPAWCPSTASSGTRTARSSTGWQPMGRIYEDFRFIARLHYI